jgi:energy-coupling factor transporter ATP-binding protein EcfA2
MPDYPQPAKTVRDVFNATDPTRPLESNDPRYVDATAVRGDENAVTQLFETIDWSDRVTTQLFTGHRGCGKSTELKRLKQRLENANFAVIYFEADEVLDLNDIVYSDVLVAIVRQVHDGLHDLGVALDPGLLDQILGWFAEVVYEQQSLAEGKAALESEFKIGSRSSSRHSRN